MARLFHLPSLCYNPQANRAERHHRDINRMLDESYSTGATIEDDIFNFCQTHNLLKKRSTGMAPIELLKGHLPIELVDDLYSGMTLPQPSKSAVQLIQDAWESRNTHNLEKTTPTSEPHNFLSGKRVIWSIGVNNKKVIGTCLKSLPTAVQIKLDESGRVVWASRSSVKIYLNPNFST